MRELSIPPKSAGLLGPWRVPKPPPLPRGLLSDDDWQRSKAAVVATQPQAGPERLVGWETFSEDKKAAIRAAAAAFQQAFDAADPDGPLVPLPAKDPPERVVPPLPFTAYQAMLRS